MSAPAGWEAVDLGDVVTLKRGYDLPAKQRREGAVPVVSSSGVTGFHDEAKVDPPGVVTGRYGTLGEVFYVEEAFWPLNTTLYVQDFKGNDPRFVSYFLREQGFGQRSGAAAVPGLNRNALHRLPVLRPPLEDQVRIAAVLAAYDELIENNTRRIQILEEIAQTLYREWFVEFRYPGHEDVPLVESDLGSIPEGWAWTTLGAAARWYSGGTPSTKVPAYWDGDTPWMTSGSLTSFQADRSERRLTAEGIEAGSRLVERDAVLLVVRGMSLAKEFRMAIADVPLAFGQDCKALLATSVAPLFLAHAIKAQTDQVLGMVQYAAHGTGLVPTDRLKALVIPQPSTGVQAEFVGVVSPMRELTSNLRSATDALRVSRDLLLTRLISGEIDLSELDIDIGDAAA